MAICVRHVAGRLKNFNSTLMKNQPVEVWALSSHLSHRNQWKQNIDVMDKFSKEEYDKGYNTYGLYNTSQERASDTSNKSHIFLANEFVSEGSKLVFNSVRKNDSLVYTNNQKLKATSDDIQRTLAEKPTPESLNRVFLVLSNTLPKLFIQPMDYSIYNVDLIHVNNIRGTKTVGLFHFVKEIALLRTIGHLKFAYVKFEVLKITQHPEDSTVKVRWRISGISAMSVMLNFWRYKIWDLRQIIERADTWYDGFSTFYVNGKGEVFKHVADKMMPDSNAYPEVRTSHDGTVKLM
ncbi:hypothetical protein WA026_023423 [Henosepilachna vigintioctopunctata]|uniref:Uncharacterized protein n=1 Tax=Henosepilachna vigintioctopunctata TaxID=420089 RepID=A0AAW1TTL3_9CUCU